MWIDGQEGDVEALDAGQLAEDLLAEQDQVSNLAPANSTVHHSAVCDVLLVRRRMPSTMASQSTTERSSLQKSRPSPVFSKPRLLQAMGALALASVCTEISWCYHLPTWRPGLDLSKRRALTAHPRTSGVSKVSTVQRCHG